MLRYKGRTTYILADYLASAIAWTCFYLYRKLFNEKLNLDPEIFNSPKFFYGIVLIPFCWIMLFAMADSYRNPYRMSRFAEISRTVWVSFVGTIALFFAFMLDDIFITPKPTYFASFLALFVLQSVLVSVSRVSLLTIAKSAVKRGAVGFNTLLIGGNESAVELYNELNNRRDKLGYRFQGFVATGGFVNASQQPQAPELKKDLQMLGTLQDIPSIVREYQIEEVIIAIETSEHNRVREILNILADCNVIIKIIPDMYDILLGTVKMNHVYGAVLIEISPQLMPVWQQVIKRGLDVLASILSLLLLSPLLLFSAIKVKLSSPGPVFYRQERLGRHGKPFRIYKFRSMVQDAEKNGPQLADNSDNRITRWGKIMRKYRIDELPQFWNVLKGDMSLVGPRPERQFFFDQILKEAPHARHLLKVRPGITSWGQVKYGYASDVSQMLQRLKFEIPYIENISLALDIKIMLYTILVVIQGRGK